MGSDPKDRRRPRDWDVLYSLMMRDDEDVEGASLVPPVDIYETGDSFILTAELPGVDRNDIQIEVAGSELTIRGERLFDSACAEESYSCLEGMRGRFCRKFSLPEEIRGEEIASDLTNGILKVILPKSATQTRPPIQSDR
jgi:HSP20 family protein